MCTIDYSTAHVYNTAESAFAKPVVEDLVVLVCKIKKHLHVLQKGGCLYKYLIEFTPFNERLFENQCGNGQRKELSKFANGIMELRAVEMFMQGMLNPTSPHLMDCNTSIDDKMAGWPEYAQLLESFEHSFKSHIVEPKFGERGQLINYEMNIECDLAVDRMTDEMCREHLVYGDYSTEDDDTVVGSLLYNIPRYITQYSTAVRSLIRFRGYFNMYKRCGAYDVLIVPKLIMETINYICTLNEPSFLNDDNVCWTPHFVTLQYMLSTMEQEEIRWIAYVQHLYIDGKNSDYHFSHYLHPSLVYGFIGFENYLCKDTETTTFFYECLRSYLNSMCGFQNLRIGFSTLHTTLKLYIPVHRKEYLGSNVKCRLQGQINFPFTDFFIYKWDNMPGVTMNDPDSAESFSMFGNFLYYVIVENIRMLIPCRAYISREQ